VGGRPREVSAIRARLEDGVAAERLAGVVAKAVADG
jgi:hypothetical protein